MTTVLEKKVVISADDLTGKAFAGIEKRVDLLAKASKRLSSGIGGKLDLISGGMSNFGYDKNLKASADIISRMSQVARSAAKAMADDAARADKAMADRTSALLAGLGKRMDLVAKTSESLSGRIGGKLGFGGGIGGNLDLISGGMSNFGYDKNLKASADMISRMSLVSSSAQQASSSLGGLGRSLSGLGTVIAPVIAMKVKDFTGDVIHTFREFDKERRFGKAVMGLTDEEQEPLVKQAIHGGATTKYNDIQFLEAQRELAARGLNKDQILGLMEPAANLGQSLDLSLPDSVKQMEGAIFGFKKDISTLAATLATARQTADVQVKAAKISGMKPEDISQIYKFGATPTRLAGVSEQALLAFGAISKKANMGGDEAGVAWRALIANAESPTAGALTAYRAAGLRYADYQHAPSHLAVQPFIDDVAQRYGVKLDDAAQEALGKIFSNKKLIASPEKFNPAVVSALRDALDGDDAKSLKSIAGEANRYRNASMSSVDVNALISDLMVKLPGNLQLSNALFGSKQGGRIANAFSDPATFRWMLDQLINHSEGYSEKVATGRMAGFDGAMSRLEGSTKNLETAFGRANDVFLTPMTDQGARFIQTIAEMDSKVHLMIEEFGAAAVAIGLFEAALKGAAVVQTLSGNPASAAAITGLGGGAIGRMGMLGWGLGVAGAGYIGNEIYKNYNAMEDSPPTNWVERMGDDVDQWAGWGRWSPDNQLKRAGIGGVSPGISSFGFGVGGSSTPLKIDGAAEITNRVELSINSDLLIAMIRQEIDARGNLRADTGRSMPETTPGAWNGE